MSEVEDELSLVVDAPSSLLLLQEMMVKRLKQEIRKTNKNFFIFSSIPKVNYYGLVLGEPYIYHDLGDFTINGKVSAENTKYAEHYISYGYSFRIYGDFEEILK